MVASLESQPSASCAARAVFIDKDGTLVENVPYNVRPERIELTAHALEGLQLLQRHGYLLIVVSNQSGVARGMFNADALQGVEERVRGLLARGGVRLDGWYACPHHPEGVVPSLAVECGCRKPRAGMIERAMQEHGVSRAGSWMVGDILDDIEAGQRAGCRTVLIESGGETEFRGGEHRAPEFRAANLLGAARAILAADVVRGRRPRALLRAVR